MVAIQVVPEVATYTLGFGISLVTGQWYNSTESQTHMELTICFPSTDFVNRLKTHLLDVKNAGNDAIFNSATVRATKEKNLSIILPSSVNKVDIDDKGIILIFSEQAQAATWKRHSGIWSWRVGRPGTEKTQLRILYKWTHKSLAEAVVGPGK